MFLKLSGKHWQFVQALKEFDKIVEVVNAGGKLMFGTEQAVSTGDVTVKLDSGFPAGQYWVRVYEPATSGRDRRGLLREFSLRIE